MKTAGTIAIIVGSIVGILIVVMVAMSMNAGIEQGKSINEANLQHLEYCNDWYLQIEQQDADLDGQWIVTQEEANSFNQQVDRYNAECTGE